MTFKFPDKIANDVNQSEGSSAMRQKVTALLRVLVQKSSDHKKSPEINENATISNGVKILAAFMDAAGQPITFIETREIWNNMCATNNGSFPHLEDAFFELSRKYFCKVSKCPTPFELMHNSTTDNGLMNTKSIDSEEFTEMDEEVEGSEIDADSLEQNVASLSDKEMVNFVEELARGIKEVYSIRTREDLSEFWFIIGSISILWITVGAIAVAGYYHAETKPKIGIFTIVTLRSILLESFVLFAAELIWECILSWIVLRYNIKINYTRKLGNLLKVPKYFVADLFPDFTSTALSMTTALAINQTLFCAMYYRRSREKIPFFSYVFLSQDRREDRPDTLIFQVTEDILRFAIYFPFKLLVVDLIQRPAIIFIPIAVNNIGDGLAEPVGVAFGKHKYSTTALYYSK